VGHQLREGFDPAGGSADCGDQQIVFRSSTHSSFQFGGLGRARFFGSDFMALSAIFR
jgi:hypothetical protein